MNWQPIDTAPTHTPVLVYFNDGLFEVAKWNADDEGDHGWWTNDGLDFNYGQDRPTHWQPLPEPPQGITDKTEGV